MQNIFNIDISMVISLASILVMMFCLIQAYALKAKIPGGVIGKRWNFLLTLVILFNVGYLATPFFGVLSVELMRFIASLIFFFGAIFVLITVKLVYQIIQELTD